MKQRLGVSVATVLADGDHMVESATKHWNLLESLGAKKPELKELEKNLVEGHKIFDFPLPSAARPLDLVREELRDVVGQMRRAGGVVAYGFGGRNAAVERALGLNEPFPERDVEMKAYVSGLEAVMKRYGAQLAERGFTKQKQEQLVALGREYLKLLALRGKERGAARRMRASRDALLEVIRTQTSYFRRLGRLALADSAMRADFDRVKSPGRPQKKASMPQETPVPKVVAG